MSVKLWSFGVLGKMLSAMSTRKIAIPKTNNHLSRFDTLNPLKRVSFLSSDTVHGHAPGSPHKYLAVLDSVPRQDNAGQTNPSGGPCPGYYHAGDFPDVDT